MQYFDRKILEYTSITNILSIFVIDVYSSQMEKYVERLVDERINRGERIS